MFKPQHPTALEWATSKVSVVLILTIALTLSSSSGSALDLKKSLSVVEGLNLIGNHEATHGPKTYAADDSLITVHGNSNKVSKALRFLHSKSGDVIFKRNGSIKRTSEHPAEDHVSEDEDMARGLEHSGLEHLVRSSSIVDRRTDDEVLSDTCKDHPTRTCQYAVKAALKLKPEDKARIALALRRKPDYVDSSKLLYHKLFESAIGKMEEKGLDSKIDAGLGLVIDRSPYGFVANQALNMAAKKL